MRKAPDRKPFWEVLLGNQLDPDEKIQGWKIHQPFQEQPDCLLVVRAVKGNGNDGGYIALAIRDSVSIDTANYQSNVMRPKHGYGYKEDDDDGA